MNIAKTSTLVALATGLAACTAEDEIGRTAAAASTSPPPTTTPAPPYDPFFSDNDPANCIDKGFVTYRNAISTVMKERCVGCHGPPPGATNPNGDAVNPVLPDLSEWSGVQPWIGTICSLVVPPNDATPAMPPPQSESQLDPEEARLFSAWCTQRTRYINHPAGLTTAQQNALLLGKVLPTIEVGPVIDGRMTPLPPLSLRYTTTAKAHSPTDVALFVDDDRQGFDGTLVEGCLPPGHSTVGRGSVVSHDEIYTWHDWQDLEPGTYFVYLCIYDHQTVACDYAEQKLQITGT